MTLAPMLDPAAQANAWQAVLDRDPAANGRFVYAVHSTGIFCRPICPSRRPSPAQVSFFPTPADAASAGFRACLRCRPAETADPDAADPDAEIVRRAAAALDQGPVPLPELARTVGAPAAKLARAFRRLTGVTPRAYAGTRRADALRSGLRAGRTVSAALYDAGYGSSSRLYENADSALGMSPARYRQGGRDTAVRYAFAESSFGRVVVAATEKGICAVSLGDTDAVLAERLRAEFPAAELTFDPEGLGELVQAVLARLEHGGSAAGLPTDVRATAFRRRVWAALAEIPAGETRTYAEVARSIGQPDAARAVAGACAGNPLAVIVPCHRVVRGDGGLGGYRWGEARKRALLAHEHALSSGHDPSSL